MPKKDIVKITYLRGEIHRRIGHIQTAHELFDRVIQLAKDLPDPHDTVSLAKQQKTNPKSKL